MCSVHKVWDGYVLSDSMHVVVCHSHHNGADVVQSEHIPIGAASRRLHRRFKPETLKHALDPVRSRVVVWERIAFEFGVKVVFDHGFGKHPTHLGQHLIYLEPNIIERFDVSDLSARIAGLVPEGPRDQGLFEADSYVPRKDQRRMDRFIQYAIAAADEALEDAGWRPKDDLERERTGTFVASGVGGFPAMIEGAAVLERQGPRRISPFLIPSFLVNLAAGQISIRHGLKGLIGAPVTACAAGAQAIGDALKAIKLGEADVILAGGAEACINRLSLAGFAAARALCTSKNDNPSEASRPFDSARDGFVMGEGAGILVLEAYEHAVARGARILAEFCLGFFMPVINTHYLRPLWPRVIIGTFSRWRRHQLKIHH